MGTHINGARKKGGNGAWVGARKNGVNARGWTDIQAIGWEHAVCVMFPDAGYPNHLFAFNLAFAWPPTSNTFGCIYG